MNTQEQAYINGFVKRASEYGLTSHEALALLKEAKDRDTSFIGRYLASGEVMPSIMANKALIMKKLDPAGEYQNENLMLSPEMYKKQRELAYDNMRNTMLRSGAGGYGPNAVLGGAVGGLAGAGVGMMQNSNPGEILASAGAGTAAGALLGVLNRVINKKKQEIVTDDDIALMKKQQKDHGMLSDLIPFRDVMDAYAAK